MAATLFALASVRNAGAGLASDRFVNSNYAAFSWAEGIIAASLAAGAFGGFRAELATRDSR